MYAGYNIEIAGCNVSFVGGNDSVTAILKPMYTGYNIDFRST